MKKWFKNLDWRKILEIVAKTCWQLMVQLGILFLYSALLMYIFNNTGASEYLNGNITYTEAISFMLVFNVLHNFSARTNNKD